MDLEVIECIIVYVELEKIGEFLIVDELILKVFLKKYN